jgi:hypothetical protein
MVLAEMLEDYNDGDMGPGHCEDLSKRSNQLVSIETSVRPGKRDIVPKP